MDQIWEEHFEQRIENELDFNAETSKEKMIQCFIQTMKEDDKHVKSNKIESTRDSSELISKIYKDVIGLLKQVRPG